MSTKWLMGNKDDFTEFVMERRTIVQASSNSLFGNSTISKLSHVGLPCT